MCPAPLLPAPPHIPSHSAPLRIPATARLSCLYFDVEVDGSIESSRVIYAPSTSSLGDFAGDWRRDVTLAYELPYDASASVMRQNAKSGKSA